MVRIGTDWYQDNRVKTFAANPQVAVSGDYTTSPIDAGREPIDPGGSYAEWAIGFQETNADFLLTANPELDLPFTTSFTFGGNRRDFERTNDYTWVGVLTAPGTFDVSNAAIPPDRETRLRAEARQQPVSGRPTSATRTTCSSRSRAGTTGRPRCPRTTARTSIRR